MNRLIDIKDKSDEEWLLDLRNVADYQFGNGAGEGIDKTVAYREG